MWADLTFLNHPSKIFISNNVGQDGILRGGCLPPPERPINNRPQVTNLPHIKHKFGRMFDIRKVSGIALKHSPRLNRLLNF